MTSGDDWSARLLAEFLGAVASCSHEAAAAGGGPGAAPDRAAEGVRAEVAAVVRDGRVACSIGFPAGSRPEEALIEAAAGRRRTLDVPGAGECTVLSVALEGGSSASSLVLARPGGDFPVGEAALVGAMARVLGLMLRTLDGERAAREESERQAEENARLLASLQERQSLFERLFRIQRSISHRAPISEVLDSITEGASGLLGDDVIGLRLIDPADPGAVILVSSRGMNEELTRSVRRSPIGQGVGALAITSGKLVVTHDYAGLVRPLETLVAAGLQAAMAAPVFQDGKAIGSLVVASYDPGRRYGAVEQEMLLAFAEHASLALNDASVVDALRRAFDDAVERSRHDALTGLPNRALVLDRLDQAMARSKPEQQQVGVLFVDLDRFKVVNDTLGHPVGDQVLMRVGERLRRSVRPQDTVGRLAGDEFVVVCEDVDIGALVQLAERIARAIEDPLRLHDREAVITASIGVAHVSSGGRAEDVLRDADVAMYRAKQRGRGRIEVFDSAIRARLLERVETEQALRGVLQRQELCLHYQPIVRTSDGRLLAVEALVRWDHPVRGLIQPVDFISLAEESPLVIQIGRWVLGEACSQLGRWQAANPHLGRVQVGVNLSARQFSDPELVPIAAAAVAQSGIDADQLSLEITESVLMEEVEVTSSTVGALKELGVCLAIDDFGTGYSSLSYLKRFPVDALKIDRTFVRGLGLDPQDEAIVQAVVSLGHALGLRVVGEGVETQRQLDGLRRLGCDAAQGYLIGPPAVAEPGGPRLAPGGRWEPGGAGDTPPVAPPPPQSQSPTRTALTP